MELTTGVYETLISEAIEERLKEKSAEGCYIAKEKIDSADSNTFFANYLAEIVSGILKDIKSANSSETITEQIKRINEIFLFIQEKWEIDLSGDMLAIEKDFLRGIYDTVGLSKEEVEKKASIHPSSGYRVSNLFTGSNRDLSIDEEMRRDILTSDSIDLMVSFILFTGLRLIIDELQEFVKRGGRLRVITTTYMGNSDPKALKRLLELKDFGNVEIKVSYTSSQERLHAKAYLFNRKNGLNTAYIGSSNLSQSAFTKGLEWNMRVTSIENKHIIEKAQASFDSYWNSENFESVDNDEDLRKFEKAISQERHKHTDANDDSTEIVVRFERKIHQIKVLEQLQYERQVMNSYRNLIIAATGTGKTAISAFDFKDYNKEFRKQHHRDARLLFVVHREQILKQARATFRSVMADGNFGEIWTGTIRPASEGSLEHLFVTVQTFSSRIEEFRRLGSKFYDYIVIDEVHHATADTYRKVFEIFTPEILIGLTATPERMDGKQIKPDFNNRFAAEIRLYDALNQQLLCPFSYFCVADPDSVNLANITFRGGKYDINELSLALTNNERVEIIDRALQRYLTDPQEVKAVCFCVTIKHADFMAEMLGRKYKAAALTSENKDRHREILTKFTRGEINYLCVVDIMNEGYDIPEIDTILFLRPTESLTIFLQQLGRGLRIADGKTELTVLDFIAQANKQYDYESRFRALTGGSRKSTEEGIRNGFLFLPRGCNIEMEKVAREHILETVKNSVFNLKRIRQEIQNFEDTTGQPLTILNFLNYYDLEAYALYNKSDKSWNALKRSVGLLNDKPSRLQLEVEKYIFQLIHINDIDFIKAIRKVVESDFSLNVIESLPKHYASMLYYNIFFKKLEKLNTDMGTAFRSIQDALHALKGMSSLRQELEEILDVTEHNINRVMKPLCDELDFKLYGLYSRDEINIIADGDIARGAYMAGKYDLKKYKIQMLFCTINKSDKEYSVETMYEDYAIDPNTFHWQSQNNTRADSPTGRLYTEQSRNGWRFLLFVRDSKCNSYGFTNPYYCLGFVDFIDAKGECPMTINWKMREPIPASLYEIAAAV